MKRQLNAKTAIRKFFRTICTITYVNSKKNAAVFAKVAKSGRQLTNHVAGQVFGLKVL